jgi:hypothetical protein
MAAKLGRTLIVRHQAEPRKIVENPMFELDSTTLAIVVLDAHGHLPAERARESPDMQRIHHVSEMQRTSWSWRKASTPPTRRGKPLQVVDGRSQRVWFGCAVQD